MRKKVSFTSHTGEKQMNVPKKKTEPKESSRFRRTAIAGISAILMMILGFALYESLRKPKPKSDKIEDIAKFAASADFNRLSLAERRSHLQKLRPKPGEKHIQIFRLQNLSSQEHAAIMNNMRRIFEQERNQRIKEYFALQTQSAKNAYLDAELAAMEQRRAEFEKRRTQKEAGLEKPNMRKENGQIAQNQPRRPSEAERAGRMKTRTETTTPESRAMRNQFMRDLQARAKETGKSFGPPHPRMASR